MTDTTDSTVRLLRLLTLLQQHAVWTGPELADRLDVSVRGVRRDISRLRELGYPVHSERGLGGGYRLAPGKAMPPLVLDGAPADEDDGRQPRRPALTERQTDVLRRLSQDRSNRSIAGELGLSEKTVKAHVTAIFRALNVANRVEASAAARAAGLV